MVSWSCWMLYAMLSWVPWFLSQGWQGRVGVFCICILPTHGFLSVFFCHLPIGLGNLLSLSFAECAGPFYPGCSSWPRALVPGQHVMPGCLKLCAEAILTLLELSSPTQAPTRTLTFTGQLLPTWHPPGGSNLPRTDDSLS